MRVWVYIVRNYGGEVKQNREFSINFLSTCGNCGCNQLATPSGENSSRGQKPEKERSIPVPKRRNQKNIGNKFRIAFIATSYDFGKKRGKRKTRLACCSVCKGRLTKIYTYHFCRSFARMVPKNQQIFPKLALLARAAAPLEN